MQDLSLKKTKEKTTKRKSKKALETEEDTNDIVKLLRDSSAEELMDEEVTTWYPELPQADSVLFKRRQHLPGFPRYGQITLRKLLEYEIQSSILQICPLKCTNASI